MYDVLDVLDAFDEITMIMMFMMHDVYLNMMMNNEHVLLNVI